MVRAISVVLLSMLGALALGCGVIYLQTRSNNVLAEERLSRDAAQSQQPDASQPADGVVVFPAAIGQGAAVIDKIESEQARDRNLVLRGLCFWLLWAMLAELVFAAAFATVALLRSQHADSPPTFSAAHGAWRMLGLGLLIVLGIDAYAVLGVGARLALMSGSAYALDIVLLFVLAICAFYFSSVFAIPMKMLPSVPQARLWRKVKGVQQ